VAVVQHVKVMMVVAEQVLLVPVQELEAEAVEQLLSVYQVPHPRQMLLKGMAVLAQLVIFQVHVYRMLVVVEVEHLLVVIRLVEQVELVEVMQV
tara:strand:- start:200 stop:481 length:282 start_codon:yes stop_codon:yes gene_type:complete